MGLYSLEIDSEKIATIVFDMPGKVNVMNDAFMTAMEDAVQCLEMQRESIKGVILTSAKSTFFAGGDLALMLRSKRGQEEFLTHHFNRLKRHFRRLEQLGVPTVAAINGTALGGGYELCLACHHRVALLNPRTQIGLPEVQFGILPAAGGVVRLTKLLGPERAAEFLLTGNKVDVATALAAGLIHATADSVDDMLQRAKAWALAHQGAAQPWESTGTADGAPVVDPQTVVVTMQRIAGDYQAQAAVNQALGEIMDTMARALEDDFDAALAHETLGFVCLVLSDNAKQRIGAFFDAGRAKGAAAA